ncbi:MAG: phosphoenolpyruvate carboxylase [Pseudomonadota bacterium]
MPAREPKVRAVKSTPPPAANTIAYLPDTPCFEPQVDVDPATLAQELLDLMAQQDAARANFPFANPVLLSAIELSRRLQTGDLSASGVEQLVQYLAASTFEDRADRLGRYVGETDPDVTREKMREAIAGLAKPRGPNELGNDDADKVRFELFRSRLESEHFGIVLTAHPTFSLSPELMHALASLAIGRGEDSQPLTDDARETLLALARSREHAPHLPLTLEAEHALSIEAIRNIRKSMITCYRVAYEVARDLYPDRWHEVTPRLVTVASWVGYDLDGRSDISWAATFHKRLIIVAGQLTHYLETVRNIMARAKSGPARLTETVELIESRIAFALQQVSDEVKTFGENDLTNPHDQDALKAISRRMYDGLTMRLPDAEALMDLADRAADRAEDPDLKLDLYILRAELANFGLAMAHTHVRINATQVHNAIRKEVGLVTDPQDERYRISYLRKIDELLKGAEPVRINFGSILAERTSVKQLFMIVAQMLKYGDRTAPVRFLIAECENAFTALTALYFAKLFGVDDKVDISPLFETERALEVGSRVIEQLLENEYYRDYVLRRGRLCVQTGYSDAGRYLGQTVAAASIERLRLRLIKVLERQELTDIQLVIFDTHGESIGRGCHPRSFAQRLSYVDTPESRAVMAEAGVTFKQETSFQGGDGYLHFINPVGAQAAVAHIVEHSLAPASSTGDPFYENAAYIREFFTTVKEFQVGLMNDRNYGALLTTLGGNLLFKSGSRPTKRQFENPQDIERADASQLRAIPHNAILMQLGLPANSISGVGAAISKDPDHFADLYENSPRLRQLMGIPDHGLAISVPMAMKAYVDTLDPGTWIMLSDTQNSVEEVELLTDLARYLDKGGLHARQIKVFRRLFQDYQWLKRGTADMKDGEGRSFGANVVDRTKDHLALLHAVRVALIMTLYRRAMRIPQFSSRHTVTRDQLVDHILQLDIPRVAEILEEIFPESPATVHTDEFGEPADYVSAEEQSYHFENEMIFRPLRGAYRLVQRISTAVGHGAGFFG